MAKKKTTRRTSARRKTGNLAVTRAVMTRWKTESAAKRRHLVVRLVASVMRRMPTPNEGERRTEGRIHPVVGAALVTTVVLILALINREIGPFARTIVSGWWWAIGAVLLIVFAVLYYALDDKTGPGKALIITLVATPAIFMGLYGIAFIDIEFRAPVVRTIFGLAATFLPVSMYYLFLVAKRRMIFDQYVTNLRQLGLIPDVAAAHSNARAKATTDASHAREQHANAFLSRFEANFGVVSESLREEALGAIRGRYSCHNGIGHVQAQHLFTPSILLPLLLATVFYGLGWLLVLPPWRQFSHEDDLLAVLLPDLTPVNFGFLGAYFFSLQSLFFRYVLRDLRPAAYLNVCQRVVLTVIASWVCVAAVSIFSEPTSHAILAAFEPVTALVEDVRGAEEGGDSSNAEGRRASSMRTDGLPTYLLIVSFLIGVFPRLLWDYIRSVVSLGSFAERAMKRAVRPELPLSELDGLNIWHEARLEEEDVFSTPNMATADIVELMLSTRFELHRIIDWVDQAILLTAIGPEGKGADTRRGKLRRHGIRTASGLLAAYDAAEQKGRHNDFEEDLQMETHGEIRSIIAVIERNRNLTLILKWQSAGQLVS